MPKVRALLRGLVRIMKALAVKYAVAMAGVMVSELIAKKGDRLKY